MQASNPRSPSELHLRGAEAPSRLLFCMQRTQLLIASCVYALLDFGISDVSAVLKIQTYCTSFIDDLIFNEMSHLSCKCGVLRDTPYPHPVVLCTKKPPWSGMSSLLQFCSYINSPSFLCQSLHPVDMPTSTHPCRVPISTNLRDPGAVICLVSQTMPSLERSQEPVAAVVPRLQLGPCAKEPAPLHVPFFGLPIVSLVLASFGARLILWVRPTFRAQVVFSYHTANKQLPSWDLESYSGFDLCLFSCRSFHDLLLSCLCCRLSCRLCQSCPHPLDLKCSEQELSSMPTDFRGLQCRPEFRCEPARIVISRARFMAKCCSNSLGTRA